MPVLGIMVRSSLGSSPAVSTKEIRHQTQSFPRLAFGDGGRKKKQIMRRKEIERKGGKKEKKRRENPTMRGASGKREQR